MSEQTAWKVRKSANLIDDAFKVELSDLTTQAMQDEKNRNRMHVTSTDLNTSPTYERPICCATRCPVVNLCVRVQTTENPDNHC